MRKALLFRWGGIYLDFDVVVLREITVSNALSWMDPDVWINGGVMVFDKGHPFLVRVTIVASHR
jgi:mannosyltransferase OCH1-like enzyme